MIKKRLKGLLAMVLAGSIAATALPPTASASFPDYTVNVYDGNTSNVLDYSCYQEDASVSGYLNSNCLWGVYYRYERYDSETGTRCPAPE